ncbi:YlbF family regulator [Brochothrix thermosphacta]|uniref:YlbF family regulator n=1 Tax=Brochothrix thermosphacta TaxID=2756 RepID=UPI00265D43A4|nr:YlbF family regulator [Brochothrix thermosphacta]WKK68262.1 YlbF family regulator [Brochothrix thermosphacta]
MFATYQSIEVLDLADELSEMINQSEAMTDYHSAKRATFENKDTQEKIKKFAAMKERFDEVQRFGRYHPDYKETNRETRRLKRELDMDEVIITYRQAEMQVQSLLDQVGIMIGESVSEQVKVPVGNPFFEGKRRHGGGCSTGGGCGCSTG